MHMCSAHIRFRISSGSVGLKYKLLHLIKKKQKLIIFQCLNWVYNNWIKIVGYKDKKGHKSKDLTKQF